MPLLSARLYHIQTALATKQPLKATRQIDFWQSLS